MHVVFAACRMLNFIDDVIGRDEEVGRDLDTRYPSLEAMAVGPGPLKPSPPPKFQY